MGVRINHRIDDGTLEPREWRHVTLIDGSRLLYVGCPHCGHTARLDDYTVQRGGFVSPIFSCPRADCSGIEYLHLEDYE